MGHDANDQRAHIQRVSARIENLVLSFARDRVAVHRPVFHMTELTSFVGRHEPVAPGSPDRILRHLRSKGVLSYTVKNRRQSLYEITNVREAA